jgi:hypothetical protein
LLVTTDPTILANALRELVAAQKEMDAAPAPSSISYNASYYTAKRRLDAAWDVAKSLVYAVPHDDTKPSRFKPGQKIVCIVDHINLEKGRVYVVQKPCWPGHEDGEVTVEGNFGHIGCEDCPFPDEYFELAPNSP